MRILALFFLLSTGFSHEYADWLNRVETRVDAEAVEWLRKQINIGNGHDLSILTQDCKTCFKGQLLEIGEPTLLIFMSFSVPETIWLSLSQEMEHSSALFVIRGLPNNSFETFAKKIAHLKGRGMKASVQIHPTLFKEHGIEQVPAFVFSESNWRWSQSTKLLPRPFLCLPHHGPLRTFHRFCLRK